jgi:hypothetical protein
MGVGRGVGVAQSAVAATALPAHSITDARWLIRLRTALRGTGRWLMVDAGPLLGVVFIFFRIMQTMQSDVVGRGGFVRGFWAWKGEA